MHIDDIYISSSSWTVSTALLLSDIEPPKSSEYTELERRLTDLNFSPPGKYFATLNLAPVVFVCIVFCGDVYLYTCTLDDVDTSLPILLFLCEWILFLWYCF